MCDTWVNLERFQHTFGVMPKAGVRPEFFINLCLGVIPKPYRCEAGFYPFPISISLFYINNIIGYSVGNKNRLKPKKKHVMGNDKPQFYP